MSYSYHKSIELVFRSSTPNSEMIVDTYVLQNRNDCTKMLNDSIRSRMITRSLLDVSAVFTSQQFVFFDFRHKALKVEAVFAHFADTRKDTHF